MQEIKPPLWAASASHEFLTLFAKSGFAGEAQEAVACSPHDPLIADHQGYSGR